MLISGSVHHPWRNTPKPSWTFTEHPALFTRSMFAKRKKTKKNNLAIYPDFSPSFNHACFLLLNYILHVYQSSSIVSRGSIIWIHQTFSFSMLPSKSWNRLHWVLILMLFCWRLITHRVEFQWDCICQHNNTLHSQLIFGSRPNQNFAIKTHMWVLYSSKQRWKYC